MGTLTVLSVGLLLDVTLAFGVVEASLSAGFCSLGAVAETGFFGVGVTGDFCVGGLTAILGCVDLPDSRLEGASPFFGLTRLAASSLAIFAIEGF